MSATAQETIEGALRLIGALSDGATASAQVLADGLFALNQMIDSWSVDRLMIYATQDQQFTWPANTQSRTLGPSGDFVGNRPIAIDDSTYYRDASNGLSFPIKLISQAQWDDIPLKSLTNTYPNVMFINMDMPNITAYLYPIPTKDLEFHFISAEELSQPAALSTTLTAPPGYLRALRYNLAVELAPEYGLDAPVSVQKTAINAKKSIKGSNYNRVDMAMDLPQAVLSGKKKSNIFIGGYW